MTDLDEERGDLNALIREAHEATKDLKQASKGLDARIRRADEISQGLNDLLDVFQEKVNELAQQEVGSVIDENLTPVVDQFIVDLERNLLLMREAIYTRVTHLTEQQGIPLLPEHLQTMNFTWQSWRTGGKEDT